MTPVLCSIFRGYVDSLPREVIGHVVMEVLAPPWRKPFPYVMSVHDLSFFIGNTWEERINDMIKFKRDLEDWHRNLEWDRWWESLGE